MKCASRIQNNPKSVGCSVFVSYDPGLRSLNQSFKKELKQMADLSEVSSGSFVVIAHGADIVVLGDVVPFCVGSL